MSNVEKKPLNALNPYSNLANIQPPKQVQEVAVEIPKQKVSKPFDCGSLERDPKEEDDLLQMRESPVQPTISDTEKENAG